MKKYLSLISVLISLVAIGQHKNHTDGIEPYHHPARHLDYLNQIDKSFLPYMSASDEDMQWWKEAKLGLFIHWAPSVVLENALSWGRKGRRPHHSTDGTVKSGSPEQEYNDTYKIFNPEKFNAEEWILKAKSYGAKYFVFTSKHHYGFCMWPTKTTAFNISNTPYKKDILKQLADACHKHDMKLLWYYSQPDWTEPLYRKDMPITEYNEKILYPQLKEILSYGVDGIWFDGLGKHPSTWKAEEMLKIIKTVNPKAIVNHRFGGRDMHMGDFDGPERGVGRFQINRPWETCEIIGARWSYAGENDEPIETKEAIKLLVKIVGNGGNLLIGTGPRPDGSILEKHDTRLKEYGKFLSQFGNAIYGTQGGPYVSNAWGSATYKGNKIYLFLNGNFKNNYFELPILGYKLKAFKSLNKNTALVVKEENATLKISNISNDNWHGQEIIELTINKDAKDIIPQGIYAPNTKIKRTVTSSSDYSEKYGVASWTGGGKGDFATGIHLNSVWRPSNEDKRPALTFSWSEKRNIQEIGIQEGQVIRNKKIKSIIISYWENGSWKQEYEGKSVGTFFGYISKEGINTSKIKIEFPDQKGFYIKDISFN